MPLRTARERLYQTLAYEACALTIAAPLYGLMFSADALVSLGLLVIISMVCVVWAPVYNTLFDLAEFALAGHAASDRPHALRAVHALGLEVSSCAVTVPVIMATGGYGLWRALAIDLVLTLFYAVYAYGFHLAYDRVRPVQRDPRHCGSSN